MGMNPGFDSDIRRKVEVVLLPPKSRQEEPNYAVSETHGRASIGYNIGVRIGVYAKLDPNGCGRSLNEY